MRIEVQKSFEKDVENIFDKKLALQLNKIMEDLENCKSLIEIKNLKKLIGKGSYYRIRIGNYRLGLKLEEETITLLRFLNKKDIYTYFP